MHISVVQIKISLIHVQLTVPLCCLLIIYILKCKLNVYFKFLLILLESAKPDDWWWFAVGFLHVRLNIAIDLEKDDKQWFLL